MVVAILITNFYDLIENTCSAIQTFEKRKNKRSEREQKGFELAVKHILELLWKSHQSYPYRLPKINLNGNFYRSSNRYKEEGLTYRHLIENVYQPLQKMGWIKDRFFERTSWDGATIIAISVLVLVAAPIVKLLAWPALAYGIYTLLKEEKLV